MRRDYHANSPCFRRMYFLRLCPAFSLEYFSDLIMKPFPALSIIMGAFDSGSVRLTREAILPNGFVLYGSSNPGKRSFGRFSRPLLEVYFPTEQRRLKAKSLAIAESFRYCKGFCLFS